MAEAEAPVPAAVVVDGSHHVGRIVELLQRASEEEQAAAAAAAAGEGGAGGAGGVPGATPAAGAGAGGAPATGAMPLRAALAILNFPTDSESSLPGEATRMVQGARCRAQLASSVAHHATPRRAL